MAGIKNNGKTKHVFLVPKVHSKMLSGLAASRTTSKGGRLEGLLRNASQYERDKEAAEHMLSKPIFKEGEEAITIADLYTTDLSIVEMPVYSTSNLKEMASAIVGSKEEEKIGAFVSALISQAHKEYWDKLNKNS